MESIKIVAIAFAISFCIIFIITNERFRKVTFEFLNHKIWKSNVKILDLFVILISIIIIWYCFKIWSKTKEWVDFKLQNISSKEDKYDKYKNIASMQNKNYNEILENTENDLDDSKNPYIPEGFSYLEGEWNTGFVIEDEKGNQFVWIPCTKIDNNQNVPILEKKQFKDNNSGWFSCYEEEGYEQFIVSCLENGGFYVSRYEIGKEENTPVSKSQAEIWTNITCESAKEIAENMYSNINSKLMNGYAADTMIMYVLDELKLEKVEKNTGVSGNISYKNIFDITDDMNEMTTEMRNDLRIYRGNLFGSETSRDQIDILYDRLSGEEEFISDHLGFRTIIYK